MVRGLGRRRRARRIVVSVRLGDVAAVESRGPREVAHRSRAASPRRTDPYPTASYYRSNVRQRRRPEFSCRGPCGPRRHAQALLEAYVATVLEALDLTPQS